MEPYVARQDISYEGKQEIYLPPSFLPRLASMLGMPVQRFSYLNLVAVRLRHGLADFPAYSAAAVKAGEGQVFVGDPTNVVGTATAVKSASSATRVQAWSLMVFGLLALAITVALVGQGLSRQVLLPASERATLRASGASRGQLAATALVSAGLTALLGAELAFVAAVVASPLMPIGLARQAEIHPGVDVDIAILVGGAGVLALLMTLWCAAPAWRAAAAVGPDPLPAATDRIPVLAGGLARMLRSPSAGMGVRFALSRGAGRRVLPVVSAWSQRFWPWPGWPPRSPSDRASPTSAPMPASRIGTGTC